MERSVLIRIGEIYLKGRNKNFFVNVLKRNIRRALLGLRHELVSRQNRLYVENYDVDDESEIVSRLTRVFGLHSVSRAIKTKTDIDEIARICVDAFPKEGRFRVSVKRADKRLSMNSTEIAAHIGEKMLENSDRLTVDLRDCDFEANVDIRENGETYVFRDRAMCPGGLPVGCGGSGMALLSGGIDSPVAMHRMAKRGMRLHATHFFSFPYTGEAAKQKAINLAEILSTSCGEITLHMAPFAEIQREIREKCPREYLITLMRRFMMRIAERLARDSGCAALITGESLGQVASQTAESMAAIEAVVGMPVFRPLIGSDKSEIVEEARRIGTYETSILPYEDCCTVFVPKNPIIHPTVALAEEYEKALDVDRLVSDSLAGVETLRIGKIDEK